MILEIVVYFYYLTGWLAQENISYNALKFWFNTLNINIYTYKNLVSFFKNLNLGLEGTENSHRH